MEGLLRYAHLQNTEEIWNAASQILVHSEPDDEIKSTASSPNDIKFEYEILHQVLNKKLFYKRLICYVEEGTSSSGIHTLPRLDEIHGASEADIVKNYLTWYDEFSRNGITRVLTLQACG